MIRPLIVEFIGTFGLIFFGAGSIILTSGSNLVAIALAHGLAIAVMVVAAGHISGGLYNPALTLGLMVTRKLDAVKGVAYMVAEVLGAILAALVLKMVFTSGQYDPVNLGATLVAPGSSVSAAFIAEFIGTFFLMFVVFGAAIDPKGNKVAAGLAIGLTISAAVLAFGGVSGASINPARAIGPALVQGAWADQWLYWVAPFLGAAAAAMLYFNVLMDRDGGDVSRERRMDDAPPRPREGAAAARPRGEGQSTEPRRRRRQ